MIDIKALFVASTTRLVSDLVSYRGWHVPHTNVVGNAHSLRHHLLDMTMLESRTYMFLLMSRMRRRSACVLIEPSCRPL